MTKPYLSFAGSYDCIAPYGTNQLPTYDSSGSPCKYLIELQGASHCQFGAGATTCNFGETTTGCGSPPLSRTDQIDEVLSYLNPYLDYHLKGVASAAASFDSVYAADMTSTKTKSCAARPSGITDVSIHQANIYPNPASDMIYVMADKQISEIRIMDYTGKILASKSADAETNQINISALSTGIYWVEVISKDGDRSVEKMVKN
jgi:hypothetical protein